VFNGKIANPCIFGRALRPEEIRELRLGASPADVAGGDILAAWDFSADISSARVTDTSKNQLHGRTINVPARAVTGPNWTGGTVNYREAPREYGAIHFHEDDLEDAGWEPDFEWEIPAGLRSGVYAVRLTAGECEDHIPFFVRAAKGTASARVALLLPTLTYLAYANEHLQFNIDLGKPGVIGRSISPDPLDICLAAHPEWGLSFYDLHADGSGNVYSTRLRPIVNLRPKYRMWLLGSPRGLSADLYLVDWLEQKGFAFDVLTDEDLHHEGYEVLSRYRAVITGTHPEYSTANMLDGLESYVRSGGQLLYLGGNGFYWVTAVDPERPHIFELRRGHAGTRSWEPAPGECYHSTTGETGGLWRHRGRPPNALVGIGFAAMGWDTTPYGYQRLPGSFDKRARFIFEGIGDQEIIGEFGLVMGGAAGDELDRVDYKLGTPPHCLLLASSGPHGKYYVPVIEDFAQITPSTMEDCRANVRADMTYFETPKGGAVFSVGSISWAGSLSHNNYQNNVSRITENVLRKFLS
jgi:N,N-dimethylformamidase